MGFKYNIDPSTESGRDTLCQALRYIHRRFAAHGDLEGMLLAAKSFDFAKRIVAKAQEHKAARGITGSLIHDGHPDQDD
jgi:hypothetical protein